VIQAERNTVLGAASAYLYWFTWQTPILDGRPRAFHCSELPFVFDNTDRCAAMTGGTAESRTLGAKAADVWIAFAKKGDPNHLGIPKRPVFNAENGPVIIFDNKSEVKNDPDRPSDWWSRAEPVQKYIFAPSWMLRGGRTGFSAPKPNRHRRRPMPSADS
jgi:carboxylesterase type B